MMMSSGEGSEEFWSINRFIPTKNIRPWESERKERVKRWIEKVWGVFYVLCEKGSLFCSPIRLAYVTFVHWGKTSKALQKLDGKRLDIWGFSHSAFYGVANDEKSGTVCHFRGGKRVRKLGQRAEIYHHHHPPVLIIDIVSSSESLSRPFSRFLDQNGLLPVMVQNKYCSQLKIARGPGNYLLPLML